MPVSSPFAWGGRNNKIGQSLQLDSMAKTRASSKKTASVAKVRSAQKTLITKTVIARFRAEQALNKLTGKRLAPQVGQDFLRARAEHYFERFPPSANHLKIFAAKHRKVLRGLARLIRDFGPSVHDKAVRRVTDKINKSGFAFVKEDCEGHFFDRKTTDRVNPRQVKPGQKLFFKSASFDIVLSRTEDAMAFKDAIYGVFRSKPFRKSVHITPGMGLDYFMLDLFFSPRLEKRKKAPLTKEDIPEILRQRNEFLKALEAIVDRFAAAKKSK